MEICSVITSFTTGGAETLVCNLSRCFVRAGHRASIVALSDAKALGNSPESERQMIARLRGEGIFASSLGLDGRRSILRGRRALAKYLNSRPPDVLHLHTARATLMAGLAGSNAPIILTHHNSRLTFSRHLYKLFDRFVFSYVAISSGCASQTRKLARRPVRLIFNGAEVQSATGTPRSSASMTPTVIAVGTISDQKDYPTLIAAARRLKTRFEAERKTFILQIVGGGEDLHRLEDLVRKQGLEAHVHLLGVRNDVPALLRSADLFVNSSHYEGLSVAMIEALISALPIVATDVPGNSELVRRSENGILVAPGDAEALSSAIAEVLLSPPIYRILSNGALASSGAYTLQKCADEHLKLYEEAIAFNAARRRAA